MQLVAQLAEIQVEVAELVQELSEPLISKETLLLLVLVIVKQTLVVRPYHAALGLLLSRSLMS